jgi:hypothetical protein
MQRCPETPVNGVPGHHIVAGAGFEPATSGCHRRHRNDYGVGPETTDSLGVVRDLPSLPVSGYPSSTGSDGPNLDTKWTRLESAVAGGFMKLSISFKPHQLAEGLTSFERRM